MENWEEVFAHYNIFGKVTGVKEGPLVTRVEFLPIAGTKIKNVQAATEDIAREMKISSLRIDAIENTNLIGIEIPSENPQIVDFNAALADAPAPHGQLPIFLGVDVVGNPVWTDLSKLPHLLVAGTTGSGKSVGLNTFILSLIKYKSPNQLKFVLIDPKRVEFSVYSNQKYLLCPVVFDNMKAIATLKYLVNEMERRYGLLEQTRCKNIAEYNESNRNENQLPYIVCVIDEFADLTAADKSVEKVVQILAQKARSSGIHLILATQRPSVDVVTGVLKADFPARLSYKTASMTDSRTILNTAGAEKLIGRGDALFLQANGELKRVHGAYVSDKQIATILAPFRATVNPLDLPEQAQEEKSADKKHKSWLRRIFDFWFSLRQKDRKLIIRFLMGILQINVKTNSTTKSKRR